MNLFKHESRSRLATQDADANPKFRSLGTRRGEIEFDRLTAGGACRPVNSLGLSRRLDLLVAEGLGCFAAGQIEFGEGNIFVRSQLTILEADRGRIGLADAQ